MDDLDELSTGAPDMAGSGREPEAAGKRGALTQGNGLDVDGGGGTGDELVETSTNAAEYADEYHAVAATDAREDVRIALSWVGPLPHPNDFNMYSPAVQDRLLDLYARETERRIERQDKALESAVNLDLMHSERENKLAEANIESAKLAQSGTLFINLVVIVVGLVLGLIGNTAGCVAAFSALAVVNVATLFVPLYGKGEPKK